MELLLERLKVPVDKLAEADHDMPESTFGNDA